MFYKSCLTLTWVLIAVHFSRFVNCASIGEHCTIATECIKENKNSFCANHTCQCYYGSYSLDNSTVSCQALVGDKCNNTDQPDSLTQHSTCIDGKVTCLPEYISGTSTCFKGNVTLGGSCQVDNQCYDPNAVCVDNVCYCRHGFVTVNETAYCKSDLHTELKCLVSESCPEHSSCHNGYCRCHLGYFGSIVGYCKLNPMSLYQYCNETKDCTAVGRQVYCYYGQCECYNIYYVPAYKVITTASNKKECSRNITSTMGSCTKYDHFVMKNAECKNNNIKCRSGYRQDAQSLCVKDVAIQIGDPCDDDLQCSKNQWYYASCINSICTCEVGFISRNISNTMKCAYPAGVRHTCGVYDKCVTANSSCKNEKCACDQEFEEIKDENGVIHCSLVSVPTKSPLTLSMGVVVIICLAAAVFALSIALIVTVTWINKKSRQQTNGFGTPLH